MGDLAGAGRRHRGPVPVVHQAQYHLPRRQDRRRTPLGAGVDRHYGGRLCDLPFDQRPEEDHQDRPSDCGPDRPCRRRAALCDHQTPDPQTV